MEDQRQSDHGGRILPATGVRRLGEVSSREAAQVLGISERSVRYAIERGDLPATKRGGAYRIAPDALAQYASGHGVGYPYPLARLVTFPAALEPSQTLPAPGSAFVGRNVELAGLTGLLVDPAVRLVALTGPGGIGKTRLAIAAATAVRAQFRDGVVFVPLAAIAQAELVVPAIADALGVRELPDRDRRTQLRAFLRGKDLLIVLDNVEQVLAAAPELATLVAESPAITLLVTSRAPLRVGGEREVPVPPLSGAIAGATSAELLASDAGRLFVAHAQAHDPSFSVDDESAPLIAEICARLDGLPLAIELAAARIKLLPPRHLRDRLNLRLPLLVGGARDAPARHRTMRDAIAWSYDLLSPEEQRLFRRLAVFADGCTLDAAEYVGGDTLSVLELIGSLVDQSLLAREIGADGEPHFRMLETVREYGLERLEAAEAAAARAVHAQYFLNLTQALRWQMLTRATSAPLTRLAADEANLRAAHEWLVEHGPAADFAAIVAASYHFCYESGRLRDAEAWIERALTSQDDASPVDYARLLIGHAILLMVRGESARAETVFTEALPRTRAVGDPIDLTLTLVARGAALNYSGRHTEADAFMAEALAVAETIEDQTLRAAMAGRALANLGVSARGQGDLPLAETHCEEALRRIHGHGLDLAETRVLMDLGDIAKDQGDYRLAVERYLTCIERTGERGELRLVADALAGIAHAAAAWGQARSALLLLGAAAALYERFGTAMFLPLDAAMVESDLAALRESLGDREVALTLAQGRVLRFAEVIAVANRVSAPALDQSAPLGTGTVALTRREKEVLTLIAEGQTDREIAAALYMSPRTASWHVRTILAKLGVSSRREAITQARATGLA